MMKWQRVLFFIVASLLVLSACTPQPSLEDDINAGVKKVIDSDGGATGNGLLRMSYVASNFKWDRLYIFPPYTTKKAMNKCLGFEWEGLSSGMDDDQYKYLVFVKGDEVVRTVKHHRNKGDFDPISKGLTPNTAVFLANKNKEGNWELKPAGSADIGN
ncbi:hypothetical protein [Marininema halotolerans]|uniref:Lipoprotein n=1 Tax=Marininema halotolerans TaxID=1155944 RepID=A0A1I6PUL4_9BACL|nr:hypothetical protein [Marininema halotolerans]SFS43790.1 hypothetical protein SAMN05444972_102137 [Marininema halotolerans]